MGVIFKIKIPKNHMIPRASYQGFMNSIMSTPGVRGIEGPFVDGDYILTIYSGFGDPKVTLKAVTEIFDSHVREYEL
jgi:hypothetical protein